MTGFFGNFFKIVKKRGIGMILKFLFTEPIALIIRFTPFPPLRMLMLKIVGAKVHSTCLIYDCLFFGMEFGGFSNLRLAENVHIGRKTMIDLCEKVTIEKNATISPGVSIITHQSAGVLSPMQRFYPEKFKPVHIKRGAWIGAGAIVLAGVTIGEMSVIAAGSVVTDNVPAHTMYAGVPAKLKKKLK